LKREQTLKPEKEMKQQKPENMGKFFQKLPERDNYTFGTTSCTQIAFWYHFLQSDNFWYHKL
jgi:hypothetical protein